MSNTLALKPYIENIRKHCSNLSKDDLTELLCRIAQEVPVRERDSFLENLSILSIDDHDESFDIQDADEILSRIEGLIEDIIERQKSIDDGSYYEDHYEYHDYYGDEMPDEISEDQQEELETLFSEADELFLAGNSDAAKKVYQELTGLFGHNDQKELYYTIYHTAIDINWHETLARYCRCVYEASSSDDRPAQMLFAMEIEQAVFTDHYDTSKELLPSLRDIFDVKVGELDGWHDFLEVFKEKLKQENGNRAFLLYLEAINYLGGLQLDGLQGVTSEVRNRKIPVGYLYWLDQLETNKSWHELAEVSQESLDNMPFDNLRTYAADKLSVAGENIKESSLVLQGKRERFFSVPQEENLLFLLKESIKQDVKEVELTKALDFLEPNKKSDNKPGKEENFRMGRSSFLLKIKVTLMLGNLEDAYSQIDKKAVADWSYGKQTSGCIYASILLSLIRGNSKATTIHGLFNSYLGNRYTSEDLILDEIQQSLSKLIITKAQKEEWFQFIHQIAGSRVDHIVSNKYRSAYDRAAATMGGYMECMILHDQKDKAVAFLKLNRNQKYNRFSAFRAELDNVLRSSPLLARL
jgi:hypothetical protein